MSFLLVLALVLGLQSGVVNSQVDSRLTIFYLHGKIVEDQGDGAMHPQYGVYSYNDIVEALALAGAQVVSEIRPANTNRSAYAALIAKKINTMITAGVPAEKIVVIGFSKGAQIAVLVSQILQQPKLRIVVQAVCGGWTRRRDNLRLVGDILSMYEKSDGAGSCEQLLARNLTPACEVGLNTGLGHGLFYRPAEIWRVPLLDWINTAHCPGNKLEFARRSD